METLLCVLVVVVLNVVVVGLLRCGRGCLCLWSTVLVAAVGCVGGRAGVGGLVLAAGGCRWVVVNLWWLFLLFLLIVFVFVRCCS